MVVERPVWSYSSFRPVEIRLLDRLLQLGLGLRLCCRGVIHPSLNALRIGSINNRRCFKPCALLFVLFSEVLVVFHVRFMSWLRLVGKSLWDRSVFLVLPPTFLSESIAGVARSIARMVFAWSVKWLRVS